MFAHHGLTNNQTELTTSLFTTLMQEYSWFWLTGRPNGFESPAGSSAICIVGGIEKRQVGIRSCIDSIAKAHAPIRREEASERGKSSMLKISFQVSSFLARLAFELEMLARRLARKLAELTCELACFSF